MIGVRHLIEYLSVRRLRRRVSEIASLAANPHVTVYPRELVFNGPRRRVSVLTPHADDETFGAGGVLLHHLQRWDEVLVLLLSDNVASIEDTRLSDERKRAIREAEFDHAAHSTIAAGLYRPPPGEPVHGRQGLVDQRWRRGLDANFVQDIHHVTAFN